MQGYLGSQGNQEYHKVIQCNKPHRRDLLGRNNEWWLLLTGKRDSRGLGRGEGLYRVFGACTVRKLESTALPGRIVWPLMLGHGDRDIFKICEPGSSQEEGVLYVTLSPTKIVSITALRGQLSPVHVVQL